MTLLWTPSPSATLSGGGFGATIDNNAIVGGQGGTRANIGRSTGKWYFEVDVILFDGILIGLTATNGALFPGLLATGLGFLDSGYFHDGSYNGGGTVNMNAPMRVGCKVDLDGHTVEFIGPGHPEGTDVLSIDFGGATMYPAIGTGYTDGAPHLCSGGIYGEGSQFTIPHNLLWLPFGLTAKTTSAFLELL